MKENKKIIIIISTIIILLCVAGLGAFFFFNKNKTTLVKEISISELRTKIDNKDTFILVITQTGCSHCAAYAPVLESVSQKYNVTFYEVNQTDLSNEDTAYLKSVANISGTPTTIFYSAGVEKTTTNRLVGSVTEKRLISALTTQGYIHE